MIYQNEALREISFPLGGIGSGSIGLSGNGMLADWEIYNRPNKGSRNGYTHIAVKAVTKEGVITRILNGDITKNLMGEYRQKEFTGYGYGPDKQSMCGFPHFRSVIFDGAFPIAKLTFTDEDFPGIVTMTAFNPFIPLDPDNSSIPAAFFEITVENKTKEEIQYQLAFCLMNPFECSVNEAFVEELPLETMEGEIHTKKAQIHRITLKNAGVDKSHTSYGDLTIATDAADVMYQTYWYRGGWQDGVVSYWNNFNSPKDLQDRTYDTPGSYDGSTLAVKLDTSSGGESKARFLLSWNVPNNYCYWGPDRGNRTWKNYYAVLFEDSAASAIYSLKNWDSLYQRTDAFRKALYGTTLDPVILDAAGATMSVLKTATVLRLEDGSFYGWEGMHEKFGSCEGTCEHVWNYAYALCFLFPTLERSIRDMEFEYSTYEDGWMVFRTKLPLGTPAGDFRACVDGQMGSVIKSYREWKISGDDAWLKKTWPAIKKVLEYAWSEANYDEWDRDKDGVLEGRQHHTLDMELFGPSSWLQSMYHAALKAAAEMAEYLGETKKAAEYREIFQKGYDWTKENLFNGSYFTHKIDLNDKSIVDHFNCADTYWNAETGEIKYQIGEGSEIDQMLGQWHSIINGLGDVLDPKQCAIALESMIQNHYKDSMRHFTNPWRIFALNDDAGSVMCDYPTGAYKPTIPIPYCEETMHGFEYAFAGLLFAAGRYRDGIKVVKAVRDRYDGQKRNPWNEIECGNNYARSMASFAFLPILSGFSFHLPKKYIGFSPVVNREDFKTMFSLGTGWGTFSMKEGKAVIRMQEGSLTLEQIGLDFAKQIDTLVIDGEEKAFVFEDGKLSFAVTKVTDKAEISYQL